MTRTDLLLKKFNFDAGVARFLFLVRRGKFAESFVQKNKPADGEDVGTIYERKGQPISPAAEMDHRYEFIQSSVYFEKIEPMLKAINNQALGGKVSQKEIKSLIFKGYGH